MYSVILLFPINGTPHICVAVVEYVQGNIVVSHNGTPHISAFTCENIELKVDSFNINVQCNIVVSHK